MKFLKFILTSLSCVILIGCAVPEEGDARAGWTAEQLYAEAKQELDIGRYTDAIKLLQRLEARYPFSIHAQQAQIDVAWAYYKDNERGLALAQIDRFLKTHPNHSKLAYMHYLKGLVNFNQRADLFGSIAVRDLSERDLQAARESFDSFKTVLTRFPNSKFVADARQRMQHLVNSMAAGEVSVARYYYQRGAYVAAANRAQEVVRQFQNVPAVEEALFIMMRSYENLGLDHLTDGARVVWKTNFPNSKLTDNDLAFTERSWWQVWR